ncbi:spermine/spermidine synthase domain-containing protein, partial [Trueperella pyogenes]
MDEYRYHEALVHVPMAMLENPRDVLILGGGDGLAAREVLKYPGTQITLVDLDKAMTDLSSRLRIITDINRGSLSSPRVMIINDDAYKFLERTDRKFDLILVDLPD